MYLFFSLKSGWKAPSPRADEKRPQPVIASPNWWTNCNSGRSNLHLLVYFMKYFAFPFYFNNFEMRNFLTMLTMKSKRTLNNSAKTKRNMWWLIALEYCPFSYFLVILMWTYKLRTWFSKDYFWIKDDFLIFEALALAGGSQAKST